MPLVETDYNYNVQAYTRIFEMLTNNSSKEFIKLCMRCVFTKKIKGEREDEKERLQAPSVVGVDANYYTHNTVKPPKKRHFGDGPVVPCREVVLFSDVFFGNLFKGKK